MQLAGGHIDSNVNNPNENIGQWKAGDDRPLCVFSPSGWLPGPKVTEDMGWSDIPTCKEAGIPIDNFQMPRTVWLPAGVPRRGGRVLCDDAQEGQRDAGVEEVHRAHIADRRFLSGDELQRLHQAGRRPRRPRCSRRRSGSFSNAVTGVRCSGRATATPSAIRHCGARRCVIHPRSC